MVKEISQSDNLLFSKLQNDILTIIAACLNTDKYQIDLTQNLSEYCFESIVIINIIKAIAEVFNLELSPASLYGHKTFESYNRFLLESNAGKITALYNNPSHSEKIAAILKSLNCGRNEQTKREMRTMQTTRCSFALKNTNEANKDYLILLSARNNEILKRWIKKWLSVLKDSPENEINLPFLAEELVFKRDFFDARLSIVAQNKNDLYDKLNAFMLDRPHQEYVFNNIIKKEKNQINLFMSHPAGRKAISQWASMGRKDKIAQLWAAGVPIDWKILYPHRIKDDPGKESIFMDQLIHTDIYAERIPALLNDIAFDTVAGIDKSLLSKAFDALEELGSQATLYLFQQHDIFIDTQTQYHLDQIRTQMGISFKFERFFKGIIHILRKYRIVERENDQLRLIECKKRKSKLKLEDIENWKNEFIKQFPFFAPHIDLLWICMTHVFDVISENKTAVEVMFPNMSMHLVEPVYKNNPLADYFNEVTCAVLRSYIHRRIEKTPKMTDITILELGAGTGGTSCALFQALQAYAERLHYIYTDVSSGFVQYGKGQYSDKLPQITFKHLDIEEDVEQQGFETDSVDIVLAANVVHATMNIKINLMNIKKLLKKNGWLVLNEVTKFQTYSTLTFGLLDGWWLYEDEKNRIKHSPLLSFEQWKKLLNATGFPKVVSLNEHYNNNAIEFQDIIVAESNGCIL